MTPDTPSLHTDYAKERPKITEAITEHWGERCAERDEGYDPSICPCCAAWDEWDAIAAELELALGVEAEVERLRGEVAALKADAARYRWIRDEHVQMSSPKMDGQHHWRFRCNIRGTGNTVDVAIDKEIRELQQTLSPEARHAQ